MKKSHKITSILLGTLLPMTIAPSIIGIVSIAKKVILKVFILMMNILIIHQNLKII